MRAEINVKNMEYKKHKYQQQTKHTFDLVENVNFYED
jgi:hypothetical protein